MKKLMAVLLAVVFVAVLVPMTVSARTLTEAEEGLIEKLSETISVADGTWQLPKEMINKAKNYLAALDEPLPEPAIENIKNYFDHAAGIVAAQKTGVSKEWSIEARDAILNDVDAAAQQLGLHAIGNQNGGISIIDPTTGATIVSNSVLKKTGASVTGIVLASAGALALLAACAFVCKKVDLF